MRSDVRDLEVIDEAPELRGSIRFEQDEPEGLPWWAWALGAGAGAGVLYFLLKPVEPKSMPIVLDGTVRAFAQRMLQAAQAVLPGASAQVYRMIAAHAAYESGWGKATAFKSANNPFNLTTISGPFVPGPDTEYDAAGNVKKITQKWAVFPSIEAGTAGYLAFIRNPRYTDSYNKLINGDTGFIDSLYRGGYFTLPLATYKANYLSVLNRVTKET